MKNKITVIHHSADFDGLFCREIARKFLPEADLIGWDFGNPPVTIPPEGTIYIMDLPVDRVFGFDFTKLDKGGDFKNRVVWIDHHKSSIDSHPTDISGYRIDGVAACRLAWQWFSGHQAGSWGSGSSYGAPTKQDFIDRKVVEPCAVRLAGEYDIWDKRDPDAEVFQFGLRSVPDLDWAALLAPSMGLYIRDLLLKGSLLQRYQQQNDAGVVNYRSFLVEFEGLKFLALNTARCNSLSFAAKDVPETGHDALMGFYWNGTAWNISLYHAKHRTELDLSRIAVKFGGGGHRGACGFRLQEFAGMMALLLGLPAYAQPKTFEQEICDIINRHSMENGSNTPDYILARYLLDTLQTFNKAVKFRAYWHGHEVYPIPGTKSKELPACPPPHPGEAINLGGEA